MQPQVILTKSAADFEGDYSIEKGTDDFSVWHVPSITRLSSWPSRRSAEKALNLYAQADARRARQS